MRKSNSAPPLPPLSFEALQATEDIEEYAHLSLGRCGDARYYNTEKALGIMRTCVIEVLASRLGYYETLDNYHPKWLGEIREIVVRTVVGLVGVDIHNNEKYYSYFVDQTARRYLTDRARKRKKLPSMPSQPKAQPIKNQLDAFRVECRLTVEDIAETLDVSSRSVYRHLSGAAIPRTRQIAAYEKLFSEKLGKSIHLETSGKRQ
jgi:DNA-binding XRE family transcriptional regulator